MPRRAKAKPSVHPPVNQPPPVEESRAPLAAAAEQLHALASATQARAPMPDFEAYLQAGRGPAYQRDYDTWMKHKRVAFAFEEAAYRLDQVLTALGGDLGRSA